MKAIGVVLVLSMAATLCGCDGASTSENVVATEPEAAPVVEPNAAAAANPNLPPLPIWVAPYVGKAAKDVFELTSGEANCLGWLDGRTEVFDGGSRYSGWGWNVKAGAPFQHVVVTNQFAVIVGGGESGIERKDVVEALPAVTQLNTGFSALVLAPPTAMIAYGLDETAKTACELGRFVPPVESAPAPAASTAPAPPQ